MTGTQLVTMFDRVVETLRVDAFAEEQAWHVLDPAMRSAALPVGEFAIRLVASPDVAVRRAAYYAVAQACQVCEGLRERAIAALLRRVEVEDDVPACRYLAKALGATWSPDAVTPLAQLAGNDDARVRQEVAASLPSAMLEVLDRRGVDTLLRLMTDPNDDVRDWATMGIGTRLNVDGTRIRAALAARLDDTHVGASDEALIGLARRRDRRALPRTIQALRGDPAQLAFEAAAYLADSALTPLLEQYPEVEAGAALRRCDPARQREWQQRLEVFFRALQGCLDEQFPGAAASVGCDLCEVETWLRIENVIDGEWCVDVLLADRDPVAATERVIRQLRRGEHGEVLRS